MDLSTSTDSPDPSVRNTFTKRCSICLAAFHQADSDLDTESGSDDISGVGALSDGVEMAIRLGILPPDYERSAEENAIVQCGSCHYGFFKPNYVALSPPPQLLRYIFNYLSDTPIARRKDLWEVFALLSNAAHGCHVDLPDPTSVLPYIGLYTVVPLKPKELYGLQCLTPLLPGLSIVSGRYFVPASPGTQPNAPNVARIFDIMSLTATSTWPPETLGRIPFSSFHLEFEEQYYWRLPIKYEVVLSGLMASVMDLDPDYMEVELTQVIYSLLTLSKFKARHGLVDRLE